MLLGLASFQKNNLIWRNWLSGTSRILNSSVPRSCSLRQFRFHNSTTHTHTVKDLHANTNRVYIYLSRWKQERMGNEGCRRNWPHCPLSLSWEKYIVYPFNLMSILQRKLTRISFLYFNLTPWFLVTSFSHHFKHRHIWLIGLRWFLK